jgi:hypothetical protein
VKPLRVLWTFQIECWNCRCPYEMPSDESEGGDRNRAGNDVRLLGVNYLAGLGTRRYNRCDALRDRGCAFTRMFRAKAWPRNCGSLWKRRRENFPPVDHASADLVTLEYSPHPDASLRSTPRTSRVTLAY